MRADQFITEIEALSKDEFNPRAEQFRIQHISTQWFADAKPLKSLPGYTYYLKPDFTGSIAVYIFDPKNPDIFVGELTAHPYWAMDNAERKSVYGTPTLMVHPDYKNQGIATELYKLVLLPPPEGAGITLLSDSAQTSGGAGVWASLAKKIPGVSVIGLLRMRKRDEYSDTELKLYNHLFGDLGATYYAQTLHYYFYWIPVRKMGRRLENAVKDSLVKIYPKAHHRMYDSFLMARWMSEQ
jgi:hypothetical protein